MAKTVGNALEQRWVTAVRELKTGKTAGQRAVHKPLLTLMLIKRAEAGINNQIAFKEIESELTDLLSEFGPPRKSHHPEYPFWHLRTSGYWKVENAKSFPMKKAGHSPTKSVLRAKNAVGYVPDEYWLALVEQPQLRHRLAQALLDTFWPTTMHEEIRNVIGLPKFEEADIKTKRARDPAFRGAVLRAYERRCAVCGYDGRLGNDTLALDAAHVRWHCEGGPDEVANGVCLCSFHHRTFDKGALGVNEDRRVLVSADVVGGEVVNELLLKFSGRPLLRPQKGMPLPEKRHVHWHAKQVFRGPPRAFV